MSKFYPEGTFIQREENREALSSLTEMAKAMEEGKILEARALMCDSDLTLRFDLGGIPAFMPMSEAALAEEGGEIRSIAVITRVGKPCCFVIDRIEYLPTPQLYLSRKKAQEKCLKEYLDHLEEGDILPARVTHFEPFGAFCDIGCGIISLLSIDCISVSRISHPSDRFWIGEEILAAVKCRDEKILGTRGRIALTHKELLGTWKENADQFEAGQTVVGIARSIENYGIFIELAPNLAGLAEYREGVKVGDGCSVYIKSIIEPKMKIKLVLVDTFHAPQGQIPTKYFITEGNCSTFSYGTKEEKN